eukprot:scaffold60397_cov67-Phaeocystis_antarctica.AAC.1
MSLGVPACGHGALLRKRIFTVRVTNPDAHEVKNHESSCVQPIEHRGRRGEDAQRFDNDNVDPMPADDGTTRGVAGFGNKANRPSGLFPQRFRSAHRRDLSRTSSPTDSAVVAVHGSPTLRSQ